MSVLDSLQNTNVLFIYYNDYKELKFKQFWAIYSWIIFRQYYDLYVSEKLLWLADQHLCTLEESFIII